MDKYEYKLKLDQLKSLVAAEDYETAAKIADSINWDRVRNANTLMMVAKVYEETNQYESCRDVLLHAYDHSSLGRSIVSQLADIAIKAKRVNEAEEYYNEFLEIAPRDNKRYVIAYKISCLKNAPLSDRIAILEELKEREYSEIWAYELAALYSEAGMREKCVETCDELILWFGEGNYVEKALDLKRKYQPLTPAQEEKYQRLRSKRGIVEVPVSRRVEATISEETGLPDINVTSVSASKFNTMNLQEELAKSMRQIMEATERETVSDTMDSIKKIVNDIPYLTGDMEETSQEIINQEMINEAVDETLKADFNERMAVGNRENNRRPQRTVSDQVSGQMSIEEVLAEWEKTKHAAEEAIAAAEQKKLELAKEQALREANDIMGRLQTLLPVLSAEPGEDLPEEINTVASALLSDDPKAVDPEEAERNQIEKQVIVQAIARENAAAAKAAENASDRQKDREEKDAVSDTPADSGDAAADLAGVDDIDADATREIPELTGYESGYARYADSTGAGGNDELSDRESSEEIDSGDTRADSGTGEASEEDVLESFLEESSRELAENTSESFGEESEEEAASEAEPVTEELTSREDSYIAESAQKVAVEEVTAAVQEAAQELTEPVQETDADSEQETIVAESEMEEATAAMHKATEKMTQSTQESAAEEVTEPMQEAAAEEANEPVQEAVPEEVLEAVPEAASEEVAQPVQETPAEQNPENDLMEEETGNSSASYGGILSEEDRRMFSYFLPVPGVEEQICQVLRDSERYIGNTVTSLTGNIIVQGEEGSGKTVLATSLIKAIQKIVGNEGAKIGKISAEALNRKDFAALVPRLEGGYLIIDKAGELSKETVQRMSKVMERNTQGLVVLLEDDSAGIRRALSQDPLFAKKFTGRVKIPVFTIDELVDFGKAYAKEMECVMEDMAVLALYNRINNIRRLDHPTTLAEVKEIVDQAIESAEGGGLKKLFAKKYNSNDFLILREKDFE